MINNVTKNKIQLNLNLFKELQLFDLLSKRYIGSSQQMVSPTQIPNQIKLPVFTTSHEECVRLVPFLEGAYMTTI